MKHALVVGGSGMLAKASLWLADQGYKVSVVGRNKQKLSKLVELNRQKIIPISVDYGNETNFKSAIHDSITVNGPYDLVVAWIHSNDKKIIDILSTENNKFSVIEWSLYHVLGSNENVNEILREINVVENCSYHQVQLGFMIENDESRWLTNEEISNGVIESIRIKSKKLLIGTLSPWDKRP